MKDLIKDLKALKYEKPETLAESTRNHTIDDVIELLQSHPVIHCKALRKKGTDEFYQVNWGREMMESGYLFPECFGTGTTFEDFKHDEISIPSDAELVPITIIVGEGEE